MKSFGLANPMGMDATVFGQKVAWLLAVLDFLLSGVACCAIVRAMRSGLRAGAGERFLWVGVALMVPIFLVAPGADAGSF